MVALASDMDIAHKLHISEIFCSLQGEGKNIGTPVVFLRTALCNLKCTWCDTKYTWDWDNYDYKKEVKELELSTICKSIFSYRIKHLVVTGGEPLLQQKKLALLLSIIKHKGYFIEVETNGTLIPDNQIKDCVDQWNVSPKLISSENDFFGIEVEKIYRYFARNAKAIFKFVINNERDLTEVESLVSKYSIRHGNVTLMPQCRTRKEFFDKSIWMSEYCIRMNFNFSPRLQILLWGNKRGT